MSYLKSVLAQCWDRDPDKAAENIRAALIWTGLATHADLARLEQDAMVYKLAATMTIAEIGVRLNYPTNSIYKMYNRHKRTIRHKVARVA